MRRGNPQPAPVLRESDDPVRVRRAQDVEAITGAYRPQLAVISLQDQSLARVDAPFSDAGQGLHVDHRCLVHHDDRAADPLAGIDLPAGCQTLQGPEALGYVRSRATARADLDRMLKQREFMAAMLNRAASPLVWLNPWRWYTVPHGVVGALSVDRGAHVWDLARLAIALLISETRLTVPVGEITDNEAGSVVVWNSDAAQALFEALRTGRAIPQEVFDAQP